jgi:hypothetical protein
MAAWQGMVVRPVANRSVLARTGPSVRRERSAVLAAVAALMREWAADELWVCRLSSRSEITAESAFPRAALPLELQDEPVRTGRGRELGCGMDYLVPHPARVASGLRAAALYPWPLRLWPRARSGSTRGAGSSILAGGTAGSIKCPVMPLSESWLGQSWLITGPGEAEAGRLISMQSSATSRCAAIARDALRLIVCPSG